jgi:hypothetical protein
LTSMFVCCFSRLLERVGMLSNIKSKAQKNRQRGL